MASEITLKYLHPSVKTYITTENYKYDTSVSREVLFVADVFEHGKDNVLQQVNTLSEYLFKYGEPNLKKFGQAGYNIEKWLTNGGSAVIMRLLPDDASYAHAVLNIQYKNSTKGKTVVNGAGEETKINDVYLRPLVTYVGINNTSDALLESELSEDRSDYATTDGYVDNFIFAVYPEGRGEYYNDLGFRIRLNPSYDGTLTSRVYTFEVIKFTGSTYDIIDGPYYVTFDPDAIDPNSQKSMFIENVVNSYSDYIKVKFNTDNYIKLATIINDEVDPYIIDVITGQSRIMPSGEKETYFSSITGKDEDVHISLRKYSTNGIALTDNGEYVLNISNNDETTKDIVDIADNSRRVIYNNQKYVTDYMRGYYNWLMQERISLNLSKVIGISVQDNYNPAGGLLLKKVDNLIYANYRNSDPYSYSFANREFDSTKVGRAPADGETKTENDSWYLRTQEIIQPGLQDKNDNRYVGSEKSGYENKDKYYTSSSQVRNTITEDGYVAATNSNLISFYHNFMKYMQFVANYDVYNNSGFVVSDKYVDANSFIDKADDDAVIYSVLSKNGKSSYSPIYHLTSDFDSSLNSGVYSQLQKNDLSGNTSKYESLFDYIINNIEDRSSKYYPAGTEKGFSKAIPIHGKESRTYPVFIDDTTNNEMYIPIVDFTCYNENGIIDKFGKYLKVYRYDGTQKFIPINGTTALIGHAMPIPSDYTLNSIFKANIFDIGSTQIQTNYTEGLSGDKSKPVLLEIPCDKFLVFDTSKSSEKGKTLTNPIKIYDAKKKDESLNHYSAESYYTLCKDIFEKFKNNNFSNFVIYIKASFLTQGDFDKFEIIDSNVKNYTYDDIIDEETALYKQGYRKFTLNNFINYLHEAFFNDQVNVFNESFSNDNSFYLPGTQKAARILNVPITSFEIVNETIEDEDTGKIINLKCPVSNILTKYYFDRDDINDIPKFDEVFSERLENGRLSNSFNKVSSYASLISRELDGKGKDTIIDDVTNARTFNDLDYTNYSLTTILNLFVGGFESIVNNMGSITDYSNYASLKYLIKTVNNNLDLRSTYLTLLNVHRNTILDLSTKLAKNNASVILGDETLDDLYAAMDTIVSETNYLVNIINTILNKTYTIYNLEKFVCVDNDKPYAYYFPDPTSEIYEEDVVDPLGINLNINTYGSKNDSTHYYGILPLLEKILINITGQNHLGTARDPIYGGQVLIEMYDDIKNGYVLGGLTQERYEIMYKVLSDSLSNLSDIHSIINVFINEKYITDIINTLIGTINVNNTVIKYNGSSYSVNSLWDLYNSGEDENLTQTMVINLINDALDVSDNPQPLPLNSEEANVAPIIQYPYFCKEDIENSISIAIENKNIVQNNILKQDRVLASLNTLCYDNFVTDINGPLSLMEGSDGSFTYDDSTTAALRLRQNKINDIRIKAYKGTWNEDVLNKDLFEFDHVLDANYEDPVKNAIITLARDERQDFFYWADTKIQNTIQDCIDWKTGFTNQTYFMSIIAQSQVWYDEYTSRNITLTSTYLIADMFNRHINSYGIHYPMAGSRRGTVGGFISNDWYPNEEQKEKLYNNKINYLEKDIVNIRIGAQNTNYPTGPLGQINNMLVLLKVKRTVEKIAKTYQFEFNTADTRSAMAAEINTYLNNWINNGACTVATASVYASDYDIIQKIVRVDVTLQFTGVIERIVINIDCPASI